MKRIIILGCPGSGKSTFAKKLHECTKISLFHLDNIWWNQNRTHINRDEFDDRIASILKMEEWIIDGDYSRTYEVRIKASDTIFFLDYDKDKCMYGIKERVGKERTDIPWTEYNLDKELVEEVKNYNSQNRPIILDLINKYKDKEILIFCSRNEADDWLNEYRANVPNLNLE